MDNQGRASFTILMPTGIFLFDDQRDNSLSDESKIAH